MRVNLSAVGPLVFGALLLLSIRWWRTRGSIVSGASVLPLSGVRRLLFGAAVGLLPVIVVLFAFGDGVHHTATDRLAVVCVIIQCLFVGAALRDLPVVSRPSGEAA